MYFFIKRRGSAGCRISYEAVSDYAKADEKVDFLSATRIDKRRFGEIRPDKDGNWLGHPESSLSEALAIADKVTKSVKIASHERAIFKLFCLGVSTNRDEWLYDFDEANLIEKIVFLIGNFNKMSSDKDDFGTGIKRSRNLKRRLKQGRRSPLIEFVLGGRITVHIHGSGFISRICILMNPARPRRSFR